MCGIFGFVTNKPSKENYKLFEDLCFLSSSRGTDSTGIAVVHKDKVIIEKAPIPSPKFIEEKLPSYAKQIASANIAIGHTRKWTQGKPEDNNNNHPVVSDSWVMVHNGVCSQMDRIKGYKYRGEVDSEILLSYVEKYGLEKGLPKLQGYAAVAILNKADPSKLFLWRHNETVYLGYDKDTETIFFGSTEEILETGLANKLVLFTTFQIRKMPEDTLYHISANPLNLVEMCDLETEPKSTWWANKKGNDTYGSNYRGNDHFPNRTRYVWDPKKGMLVPDYGTDSKDDKKDEKESKDNTPKCVYLNDDKTCFKGFKTDKDASSPCPKDCSEMYMNKYSGNTDKDKATNIPATKLNRFWFPKQSVDFVHWIKAGKYYLSSDGLLIKMWDRDKAAHFIMTYADAISDGVIKTEEE